jgi:hypothetical protein
MRADGRDKQIFAFRNFANAPKIVYDLDYCSFVSVPVIRTST